MPRLAQDTLLRRFWRRSTPDERARASFELADLVDFGDIPIIGWIAGVIGLIALIFAFGLIIVPALFALADLLILVVLAMLAFAARVVFRRPWLIEARDGTGQVLRWRIVGWRASAEQVGIIRGLWPTASCLPTPSS